MTSLQVVGMKTGRKVLGDLQVDHAEKNETVLDEPFQNLIPDAAWAKSGRDHNYHCVNAR